MDDDHLTERRNLSRAAAASAALLATLCALTLASGVSQQWFEWARPAPEYTAALARHAAWLRAIVALDDLFVAAYVTTTVLFARSLARGAAVGPMHVLVMAGGVAAGVLDLDENHHLLALAHLAERGAAVATSEIVRRSELSQLKWMLGHVAFVFAGVALRARGRAARAFRATLIAWQLPVGALAWAVTAPAWLATALVWARYASFVSGFAAIAYLTARASAAAAPPPRPAGASGAGSGEPA